MSQLRQPIRTCVGCGGRARQVDLLRFGVEHEATLQLRRSGAAGRSAYLHRQEECWTQFARRKGPLRSLRRSVDRAVRLEFVEALRGNQRH